ncbi:MAG: leucine-rich repeat protein, partial [Bacilli bacterium]|nr:leucine-rich repeat protein [Bacilli bacterium]
DSIIKKDIILPAGETIDITLRVWLSSDTKNTQIGKTFNSKIVIDGQSIYTSTNQEADSSLKDFVYYLGSEYSEVDTLYDYDYDGTVSDYKITSIPLDQNEILLVKYNGTNKNVTIPATYTIDDITYNVVIASEVYLITLDESDGIFQGNTNIENVYLDDNIKVIDSDDTGYYENNAWGLFSGCTSLVTVPKIPSSVTEMGYTFNGCTSLVNPPKIPNGVTSLSGTFNGCTSLVTAPAIPNMVTAIDSMFKNCNNLTGTIRVNSSKVSTAMYILAGTTKNITVQVPSGSTTYTTINALTTTTGKPSNVTLTTY